MSTITVYLTNGFGNNLFQYIYARLLAEYQETPFSVTYNRPKQGYCGAEILDVILKSSCSHILGDIHRNSVIDIRDNNANLFLKEKREGDFVAKGHFEDYLLYKEHIDKIRTWFTYVPKSNIEDLVFHLRLGDRLLFKNSYYPGMKVEPSTYTKVIKKFKFEQLYIVTDMKVWDYITEEQLKGMKFHNEVPSSIKVESKVSVDYFNSLVEEFKPFNPIVRFNQGISDDFNFIRSFDKILFQHGTLAWWAAAISYATQVGVYGPWRPVKGDNNKNLGKTDFPGWFSWAN